MESVVVVAPRNYDSELADSPARSLEHLAGGARERGSSKKVAIACVCLGMTTVGTRWLPRLSSGSWILW